MPPSGCSKPAISRSVVVLPEPDGPSIVKNSPCGDLEVDAVDRGERRRSAWSGRAGGCPAGRRKVRSCRSVRRRRLAGSLRATTYWSGKGPDWTKRTPYLSAMERLFDPPEEERTEEPADGPLAARMRPRTLEEFVGQEHLLGRGLGAARVARVGPAALDGALRAARAPARRRSRGSPPSTPAPRSRSSRRSTPGAPRCAR